MFSGSSRSRKALVITAGCAAIALLVFLGVRRGGDAPRDLAFTELLSLVDQGKVRAIVMSPDSMGVTFADGSTGRTVAPAGYAAANPTFLTGLASRHVTFRVHESSYDRAYYYAGLRRRRGVRRVDRAHRVSGDRRPHAVDGRQRAPGDTRHHGRDLRGRRRRGRSEGRSAGRSSSSSASRSGTDQSAAASRKACCWSGLPVPARRCWRAR